MKENDTVLLLRECDAGARMGMDALGEMLPKARDEGLRQLLTRCRDEHKTLQQKTCELLALHGSVGQTPPAVAKGMSRLKTETVTALKPGDETLAALAIDGCDMGAKSLSQQFNRCDGADEDAKKITLALIDLETRTSGALRAWL